jgi:cell division septation protein DedD
VKERLTGAIILVVLIVLLVPELLSGPSRSVPAPQAAATSSEEPPLRSYTINLADDAHTAATSAGPSNASPQASGPAQPTPIPDSTSTSQPPQSSSDSSPEEGQAGGPAPASSASTADAAPPGDQPRPAVATHSATPRPATPERPTPDRLAAESPDKGTGGWMVQLGVFSIQANAERLAQELRRQGFHTLVSENSGGGRPLWRVRAGPVAEHAAAEQLSAKLRAAGHAGSVVPK